MATEATAATATPHHHHRRLAGAAMIMVGAFVASRATGLLRDVAVSYRFGTGRELDAYLAGNRIPDLIFQITAGGAVASAFIPIYASLLAGRDREEPQHLLDVLFTTSVVLLLPIVALIGIFAPQLMQILVPGYPPEYQALAANLARLMLPMPIFFTLGCFATGVLNTHHRFFLSALAPTMYNLGIILGAIVLSRQLGIYGLASGALAGSILFLLVQLPGLRIVGIRFTPRLDFRNAWLRAIGLLLAPRVIGLAVVQANFVVTLVLASGVPGGVAALNYAWLITNLPLGIFAMAISTAVFPSLAEHGARNQIEQIRATVVSSLRFILYLTIPASIGLILLGGPVVRVLFERGRFSDTSATMTADALRFYAIGLFGMASVEIVTRAFYALKDTRTPVAIAAAAFVVNVVVALSLVGRLGHTGLALATATASIVEAVLLVTMAQRRIPGIVDGSLARSVLKTLLGSALMALAVAAVPRIWSPGPGFLAQLALLVVSMGVGASVYLGVTAALRSPEIAGVRRLLRQPVG